MAWDRRLYFPSEGRRAEDFFALKNLTASAGFEPVNLGTKGQHATPRPWKPLRQVYKVETASCWSDKEEPWDGSDLTLVCQEAVSFL